MFRTTHGEALFRIMSAYPPGPGLVSALEAYVEGQVAQRAQKDSDALAQSVCEGLHDGPAAGLYCRKCYDVEKLQPEIMAVLAEAETK